MDAALSTVHGVVLWIHAAAVAAGTPGHAQDVAHAAAARPGSPAGAGLSAVMGGVHPGVRWRDVAATGQQ